MKKIEITAYGRRNCGELHRGPDVRGARPGEVVFDVLAFRSTARCLVLSRQLSLAATAAGHPGAECVRPS